MKRRALFYLLFGVLLIGALGIGLLLPRVLAEGEKRAVTNGLTVIPAAVLPRTYTLGAASLDTALDLLYLGKKNDASALRADYLAPEFKEYDSRPRLVQELEALCDEGFILDGNIPYPQQPVEYAACYAKSKYTRADYNTFSLKSEQGYIDITTEAFDGAILSVSQQYAPSLHQKANASQQADAFAAYLGLQAPSPLSERMEGYYSVEEFLCAKEELVISVRMGEYQMDVFVYPYRYYPVSWTEGTYTSRNGINAIVTEEPAGEGKLPRMRREGFVCPTFTFYSEDGVAFLPPDLSFTTAEGQKYTISVQKKAEESMRMLYDMFGYLPESCAVVVTPYGFYFSHTPYALFGTLPEDSDVFYSGDFDPKTGEFSGFTLIYGFGFPPDENDLAKPAGLKSMTYEEVALYYYNNSSYGDRSPIVDTELVTWANNDVTVKLFLADDRFYEVWFNENTLLPTKMWGIYDKGYSH